MLLTLQIIIYVLTSSFRLHGNMDGTLIEFSLQSQVRFTIETETDNYLDLTILKHKEFEYRIHRKCTATDAVIHNA
jgi:hypothetical protein